ncbi:lipid II:glycine glycyltransferase FemX [Candidatus Absconditicoccus praedator]|uniref:lipid II:glycine glycyltransferase FemX n=1 Tax=Candidatus Absconditicoccus praedator TaxID=2735562 RepID=UPI001E3AF5C3|nr:peptidoglycan bridge formation glycyltransferase FemA/FemB family protein [Candidatus Absconditicoccus praedator]UFX82639.1 peptidoglycan bridge formation glycyltransferase FemA/FemB family protein [Candidatus Absconditicoccus praedator]
MSKLYQSLLWKTINKDILKKPTFEVEILGKKYFGIVKEKSKFGVKFRWYQVMGVDVDFDNNFSNELQNIKRQFGGDFGNILFQFGFTNIVDEARSSDMKDSVIVENIRNNQKKISSDITKKYNLKPSFRENMPPATVLIDLEKSEEEIWNEISKNTKQKIKKGKSKGLEFGIANKEDIEEFYNLWYTTLGSKGYSILPKKDYENLIHFCKNEEVGDLFLVKKDGKIVAGSICVYENDEVYYLYGAASREFGNIGQHHFLKYSLFNHLKTLGYRQFDLLGVAPAGDADHPLVSVSDFKKSLGGNFVQYVGNFDLVLSNFLYNVFEVSRKFRS